MGWCVTRPGGVRLVIVEAATAALAEAEAGEARQVALAQRDALD